MPSRYIRRTIEPTLTRAAREFPALLLTGPRQSGKTTLLRRAFGRSHRYLALDTPDVRAAASSDPRGFLELHAGPVILDEIQHAPALLPYIKERIDADRQLRGRYLLTGSQHLGLSQHVAESLAGRSGVFHLLPFSRSEVARQPARPLPWETSGRQRRPGQSVRHAARGGVWPRLLRGWYPEPVVEPRRDARQWLASYVHTYLERDVRQLRQVGDLATFQDFLRAVAARSGQLLNLADISRDLGVALNTAKAWLAVLEASFLVVIVRPWFQNTGKRLVKTPKVYFLDTGLLCYLTGLSDVHHAAAGPMAGALFETLVLGELVKRITHRGEEPRVYFWRTSTGEEVDFLVDTGRVLVPIEAKATSTPRPRMGAGIVALTREVRGQVAAGYVVHAGEMVLPLGGGVTAIPYSEF